MADPVVEPKKPSGPLAPAMEQLQRLDARRWGGVFNISETNVLLLLPSGNITTANRCKTGGEPVQEATEKDSEENTPS